ncbi:Uncharacterised protein [Mycobacteroides abscessus subsp. abscessus]|nr:Uncharacterised protein [Mycobacteroides abscessus subsp. abscessus]
MALLPSNALALVCRTGPAVRRRRSAGRTPTSSTTALITKTSPSAHSGMSNAQPAPAVTRADPPSINRNMSPVISSAAASRMPATSHTIGMCPH